jgi:hypothetical protein
VARALIDLDWRAETQLAYDAIQELVIADPSAADAIAEQWLYLALCRRDSGEMARALASIPPEGIIPVNDRPVYVNDGRLSFRVPGTKHSTGNAQSSECSIKASFGL